MNYIAGNISLIVLSILFIAFNAWIILVGENERRNKR